jgi:uncharacterized protein with von Willebrand factor type A (vWA) domain
VAIRPTDLQGSIMQSVQTAQLAQRSDEGPQQAALAAQATFASKLQEREESVAESGNVDGNRVSAEGGREQPGFGRKRRQPGNGSTFEDVVDEESGLAEPAHLIDFTA